MVNIFGSAFLLFSPEEWGDSIGNARAEKRYERASHEKEHGWVTDEWGTCGIRVEDSWPQEEPKASFLTGKFLCIAMMHFEKTDTVNILYTSCFEWEFLLLMDWMWLPTNNKCLSLLKSCSSSHLFLPKMFEAVEVPCNWQGLFQDELHGMYIVYLFLTLSVSSSCSKTGSGVALKRVGSDHTFRAWFW